MSADRHKYPVSFCNFKNIDLRYFLRSRYSLLFISREYINCRCYSPSRAVVSRSTSDCITAILWFLYALIHHKASRQQSTLSQQYHAAMSVDRTNTLRSMPPAQHFTIEWLDVTSECRATPRNKRSCACVQLLVL